MQELSLYQIKNGFMELNNADDISEEDKAKINEELSLALQNKSKNIINYNNYLSDLIANADIEIKRIQVANADIEIKRIQGYKKMLQNRQDRFNSYLLENMNALSIKKIETPVGSVTVAKSPLSVEITDESKVPEKYKTQVITTKIDKTKIKNDFKETGEVIEGVQYNTNNTHLLFK